MASTVVSIVSTRQCNVVRMPLRALLLRNGESDVELELALLQLWATNDPERFSTELLALDEKCWRRLGLLLFASDKSLVLALVATLERATLSPNSQTSDRLLERVWRSQWRTQLHEKVVDCHARLEREGIRSGRTDSLAEDDLVASRLMRILVTSLRAFLTSFQDDFQPKNDDHGNDIPKVMEVVDLLLSLSMTVERTPSIAKVAVVELHSLLSLPTHAFSGLITTQICRSTAMLHYVVWFIGDDRNDNSLATEPTKPRKPRHHHECDHIYIELLVAVANVARPDSSKRRGARSPVLDDTAAMLQMCTIGIASSESTVQYATLRLLCSLLALDDASSIALSSAIRLSGILISISWLLNHTVAHIAAMAATTLELIIRHSPLSDILRAVIEQGCVIIYRALLGTSSSNAKKDLSQAAVAASCRSLLNWVTEEVAWQSGVVAASVQSILSSSNILLQKNIVLTLQILAQRNAAIREALDDNDFQADALVTAIQADDDAGLAVSLLSICLNCSDKCSTLKIEGFYHDNNESQQEEDVDTWSADEKDWTIRLRCVDGEVKVNAALLREHSNVLRGLQLEQKQKESSTVKVKRTDKFQSFTVQLFINFLPKPQHEAVGMLVELQNLSILQELLRLGNAIGSAKCWHVTTAAICRMMTTSNWFEIFHFASTDVRHPTLVLRCIRFALQLHNALSLQEKTQPEKQLQVHPVQQERVDLASALKTAAIQLSHELFTG